MTKDAYPFGQERRSSSDSMLLQRKSSNLDNSVDYSDESFEEYDSDDNNKSDDDDDEGQRHLIKNASNNSSSNSDAVLDILKAAQQSKDGMNALRQSLVGMGKIKGITSKQQQQPHHHNNSKKKKIQQQLPKKILLGYNQPSQSAIQKKLHHGVEYQAQRRLFSIQR